MLPMKDLIERLKIRNHILLKDTTKFVRLRGAVAFSESLSSRSIRHRNAEACLSKRGR